MWSAIKWNPLFPLQIFECSSLNLSGGLEKEIKKGLVCKDGMMMLPIAEIVEVVGGLESKTPPFHMSTCYVQVAKTVFCFVFKVLFLFLCCVTLIEGGVTPPILRVTGSCKLPNTVAGSQTHIHVFWMVSKHFEPVGHLSCLRCCFCTRNILV